MRLREHEGIVAGRIDMLRCRPDAIEIEDGYNVRDLTTPEARAELDELKAQVKENGVLTPLKIRFDNDRIILVEGHRRRAVALELIEEYKATGGAEGRLIDSVPIFAETPGTTPEDRDYGLETSNSGTRLKQLELANLIYRLHTIRGQALETIAKRMGKSLAAIKQTLSMRVMPEPLKEQVRAGDISATQANKLLKNLPKGTNLEEAAKIVAANKEENRRLGVGKRTNHKVTASTLRRDAKPKAPEPVKEEAKAEALPPFQVGTRGHSPLSEEHPPVLRTLTDEERAARAAALADAREREHTTNRTFPPQAFQPPSLASEINADLFGIVAKLATEAQDQLVGDRADNDTFPVPVWLGKRALALNAKLIGDESESERPRDDGTHVDPDGEPGA